MDSKQLQKLLEKHDWTYMYSDDHRVWLNGSAELRELQSELSKADRMDAEASVVSFWNERIVPILSGITKSYGGTLGIYEWVREYLPKGHEWHQEK